MLNHSWIVPSEVTQYRHTVEATRYPQDQFLVFFYFEVRASKTKKQHDGRYLTNRLMKALTFSKRNLPDWYTGPRMKENTSIGKKYAKSKTLLRGRGKNYICHIKSKLELLRISVDSKT